MLSCPTVDKRVIRGHYNVTTPFYRLLWGPHIHHGLWEANESPRQAQLQLTERLATLAGVADGQQLVDIGCGMGASSIHLAKTRGCQLLGRHYQPIATIVGAARSAAIMVLRSRSSFAVPTPSKLNSNVVRATSCGASNAPSTCSISRSFLNGPRRGSSPAARWRFARGLPGDTTDSGRAQQVYDVCEGFFCPSLGTVGDYTQWMELAGLQVQVLPRLDHSRQPYLGNLPRPRPPLASPLVGTSGRLRFGVVPGSLRYHS